MCHGCRGRRKAVLPAQASMEGSTRTAWPWAGAAMPSPARRAETASEPRRVGAGALERVGDIAVKGTYQVPQSLKPASGLLVD